MIASLDKIYQRTSNDMRFAIKGENVFALVLDWLRDKTEVIIRKPGTNSPNAKPSFRRIT